MAAILLFALLFARVLTFTGCKCNIMLTWRLIYIVGHETRQQHEAYHLSIVNILAMNSELNICKICAVRDVLWVLRMRQYAFRDSGIEVVLQMGNCVGVR
jgi:hypothetical protein